MATTTGIRTPTTTRSRTAEAVWDEKRASRKDTREGWLFCAPYLVLFAVFVIFPAVWGLWISLHRYDFTLPDKPFIGLANYTGLITGSSPWAGVFWESLRNTLLLSSTSRSTQVARFWLRSNVTVVWRWRLPSFESIWLSAAQKDGSKRTV